MPKAKSKRKGKRYRPRETLVDPLSMAYLIPKGTGERLTLELEIEELYQKLRSGAWLKGELPFLSFYMKYGAVLARAATEQRALLDALLIGKLALDLTNTFTSPRTTPPDCFVEPIGYALDTIADLSRIVSPAEQSRALAIAQRDARQLLCYDRQRIELFCPVRPGTYEPHLRKTGLAFLHGRVVHGYAYVDEQKRLFFEAQSDSVKIQIERPVIVYLDDREEKKC